MSTPRIVLVGGDCVVWFVASALKLATQHRDVAVTVVDVGPNADTLLARWTLPSLRGLHGLLKIKETDLVRQTGATFRLGSEHVGWQGDDRRYLHPHGELGSELKGTPFYKHLLLEAIAGRSVDPARYSLAATAARLGRFARPMPNTALTSSFTYGFHLDEPAYRSYLRSHAQTLGVRIVAGKVLDVTRLPDGNLAAIQLDTGQRVEGEWFVDCSGADSVLMDRIAPEDREDWTGWLLNDRAVAVRAPALDAPAALTQTWASDAGWLWRIPLASSSVAGYVYSSHFTSDEAARVHLCSRMGANAADCVLMPVRAGRRRQFWRGNCIAIGEAAAQLEPLVGADLHLAQLGAATLIELFPVDRDARLEAIEYNRILGEHADALRDFTIAHYRVGNARAGEYWQAARAAPAPARLAHKLDLYRASGRIALLDHETFEELDWAWVLLGSGCIPESIELHVQSNLHGVSAAQFEQLRAAIEHLAGTMPRHIDFVRQHR